MTLLKFNSLIDLSEKNFNTSCANNLTSHKELSSNFELIISNFSTKCENIAYFWIHCVIILWKVILLACLYFWYPAIVVLWLMELEEPTFSKGYNIYSRIMFISFMFYVFLFEISCLEIYLFY